MNFKAWTFGAVLLAIATSGPSRAADPAPDAAKGTVAAEASGHPDVLDATWEWIWFGSGKEQFDVDKPERYTLEFAADGALAIQADCNRGTGTYEFKPDSMIEITPLAITRALCEEPSLGDRFVRALDQVVLYFEKDGDVFFEAPIDSGTLRLRRQAAE